MKKCGHPDLAACGCELRGYADEPAPEFLKKSLEFRMDVERRVAFAIMSKEREQFAIKDPDPITIPIPFHILKEAVAGILQVECGIALAKLPGGADTPRERWPKGVQGLMRVSELLMDAAQSEAAGAAILDDGQPAVSPNLGLIL